MRKDVELLAENRIDDVLRRMNKDNAFAVNHLQQEIKSMRQVMLKNEKKRTARQEYMYAVQYINKGSWHA